jgi:hypothetical protein
LGEKADAEKLAEQMQAADSAEPSMDGRGNVIGHI